MSSILLFFIVTFGAFLSSLTGLGGGTIVLAGLLLVYPPELAVPLHSFTQFTANFLRAGLFLKQVHWKVVGAYSVLLVPGAWMAAKIFDLMNPDVLKLLVGILILLSVMPFKWSLKGEPRNSTFVLLGGVSGFLGVFVGAVGPMVLPFFNRLKISRDSMLATKSAGQMFLQVSKIIAFSGAAGINFFALKEHILMLVIGSLVGVLISVPIGKKISDEKFNRAINIMLVLISLKVIFEGARGLLR